MEELTDEQAGAIEAKHGGKPDDWKTIVNGGDMDYALPLIEHLSGGPCDESSAYLKWLNERTRTLLGQSDVWLAVEAVTEALLDRRTLPAGRPGGSSRPHWTQTTRSTSPCFALGQPARDEL